MNIPISRIASQRLLGTSSRTTIYRYIHRYSINTRQQRYSLITDEELQRRIQDINRDCPNSGYREVLARLRTMNINVQRSRVERLLRQVDPVGTATRWAQVIRRRTYSVNGPNALWHLDTHHSLIRWGIIVNGGIDGHSRLIPYLHASPDNTARRSFVFFLRGIHQWGTPSRVRTDHGGEFVLVRRFMRDTLGEDRGSAIEGRSVHNQRIERLWRDVYAKVLDTFYRLFYYMESQRVLDVDNELHRFALQLVFVPRINDSLNAWRNTHNNHVIRTEHNRTPLQIWYEGMLTPTGHSGTVANNILNHHNTDVANILHSSNIQWNLTQPDSYVNRPASLVLGHQQEDTLRQINVTGTSDYMGLDVYGEVVSYLLLHSGGSG
jgi:hypothetical protein